MYKRELVLVRTKLTPVDTTLLIRLGLKQEKQTGSWRQK